MLKKLYQNFSVIPLNGKKPFWKDWRVKYINQRATFEELKDHKGNFGIVCGFEGLEVIDVDNHFLNADALLSWIKDNISLKGYLVIKTGGGGYHIYYKCDKPEANTKLARRRFVSDTKEATLPDGKKMKLHQGKDGKWSTIIAMVETRGQGGQVVFYDNIVSGEIDNIKHISTDERQQLWEICEALNEVPKIQENKQKIEVEVHGQRPGDIYNKDPDSIQETFRLLENAGWKTNDNGIHWWRPGKNFKDGPSATFGKVGENRFYNFSSNGHPFEAEISNSMMGVRAILLHNGDFSACAKELALHYGIQPPKTQQEKPRKKNKWQVLEEIINDWGLEFRYNTLSTVIDVSKDKKKKKKKFEKIGVLYGDIVREMEVNRGIKSISATKIKEMVSNSTICTIYDPIKTFFNNLPVWDQQDHFLKLKKYLNIATDEDPEYFYSMLKKHMIRTIKCALVDNYINRMVFVLHGPQEIGKTYFFRWLNMYSDLYNEEPVNPSDKDSILALGRYMTINMDELDGLNKKEVSKLKAFISHGTITKRVAYGHHDENFARVASFVGSSNKTDLLADELNTRWIILKIISFDWQGYLKNVNPAQLWAQALYYLKENKDSGELTTDEKKIRDQRNEVEFLEMSTERDLLIKYFDKGKTPMTTTDVKYLIETKLHPIRVNNYQLARELKRLFGESVQARETTIHGSEKKSGRYFYLKTELYSKTHNLIIDSILEENEQPPF